MLKDAFEAVLKNAGDLAQSYFQQQAAGKSSPSENRRLLMVISIGFLAGIGVILLVWYFHK
jgi:hypothetical protein